MYVCYILALYPQMYVWYILALCPQMLCDILLQCNETVELRTSIDDHKAYRYAVCCVCVCEVCI